MTPDIKDQARTYAEYVAEYLRIDSSANWAKGDLILKMVTETFYGDETLKRFAEEVATPYKTIYKLRQVAESFPENSRRLEFSWSIYAKVIRLRSGIRDEFMAGLNTLNPPSIREVREAVNAKKGITPKGGKTEPASSGSAPESSDNASSDENAPAGSAPASNAPVGNVAGEQRVTFNRPRNVMITEGSALDILFQANEYKIKHSGERTNLDDDDAAKVGQFILDVLLTETVDIIAGILTEDGE